MNESTRASRTPAELPGLRITTICAVGLLCIAALFTACASGTGGGDEQVDFCLIWRNTLDPDSYVADFEARLIKNLAGNSAVPNEARSALRKCLQESEADFISKVDAQCADGGSLTESAFSALTTDEWANPCIERALE